MDVSDDREIKLQQTSSSRLAEFEVSLPRLLWKSTLNEKAVPLGSNVRTLVKSTKAHDLVLLLEPFQEWPQLLDPKLSSLLQPLISAFLAYICYHVNHYRSTLRKSSPWLCPLPRAICKILYTLCKIRGEKVICQFMNNEPKFLEPVLDAFESWNQPHKNKGDDPSFDYGPMVWEERYVMLLWLSHLMLTPFDLSSISSPTIPRNIDSVVSQIPLSHKAPAITKRIVFVSLKHVESASKEREAARALLVRLVLRPDMLELGLLASLVHWALLSLEFVPRSGPVKTMYAHIGVLSILGGIVTSAAKDIIAPCLGEIFRSLQRINGSQNQFSRMISSSAVARKLVIKTLRAITIFTIPSRVAITSSGTPNLPDNLLEEVIEHLLNSLADIDTPVRYAASKALSVIAVKLEPAMAAEVVEAIVGSLEENVLWEDTLTGQIIANYHAHRLTSGPLKRNVAAINALKWHGLTLTLSHLLYRRSPPSGQLPSIMNALILALSFEQRSSVGGSLGTNVRDAACFGIWALARRYTTEELSRINTSTIRAANSHGHSTSVLQTLANEIIVAATLDSSGNIRRGASAALQELIGRHPDTVMEGIPLVQVVDYHAVALRSRAIQEVATGASNLDPLYWDAILEGLLDWRGIGSPDAPSRRLSATAIGFLAVSRGSDGINLALERVRESLQRTPIRQAEERHGLLLALTAIVRESSSNDRNLEVRTMRSLAALWKLFDSQSHSFVDVLASSGLRPELMAEALCALLSALACFSVSTLKDSARPNNSYPTTADILQCTETLNLCLHRTEDIVVGGSASAANAFFKILQSEEREALVQKWVAILSLDNSGKSCGRVYSLGVISALGLVFHYFSATDAQILTQTQQTIVDVLLSQAGPGVEIESRVAAIRSLASGVLASNEITAPLAAALKLCLDDYTTDQRGDVGSMVRVEAIDAVGVALKHGLLRYQVPMQVLVARVCGLACEKLDKVRFRAWTLLQDHWAIFGGQSSPPTEVLDVSGTSTEVYFRQLLSLCSLEWVRTSLLEGYVTSAGAGSESLLRSSRAALVHYAEQHDIRGLVVLCKCLTRIIQDNMTNDRLLVPALDTLDFLFDAEVLQLLQAEEYLWRHMLNLIPKTHYKSRNVHKLEAAVNIYSGLAIVGTVKQDALRKLCSMLLHSFPKIRNSAADAIALAVFEERKNLERINWSNPAKELKGDVHELRIRLGITN